MTPIDVEQAVFSSSNRGSMKGYQLVAKSSGIDRDTGNELSRWAPTRLIDDDPTHWTINAFPISGERYAVSRTVIGGPEYSGRGASQVVTLFLVLRDQQFSRYLHNPILLAKTAMAMGKLRLPIDPAQERLPTVELPGEPLYQIPDLMQHPDDESELFGLLAEVTQLIHQAKRVAVVGPHDPIETAAALVPRIETETRTRFSFTSGLAPAIRRPFQLHFLREADAPMRRSLASQHITIV